MTEYAIDAYYTGSIATFTVTPERWKRVIFTVNRNQDRRAGEGAWIVHAGPPGRSFSVIGRPITTHTTYEFACRSALLRAKRYEYSFSYRCLKRRESKKRREQARTT